MLNSFYQILIGIGSFTRFRRQQIFELSDRVRSMAGKRNYERHIEANIFWHIGSKIFLIFFPQSLIIFRIFLALILKSFAIPNQYLGNIEQIGIHMDQKLMLIITMKINNFELLGI